MITAVMDDDPDPSKILLSFEQYDVILPKERLEAFGVGVFQEGATGTDNIISNGDIGHSVGCYFTFTDKPMLQFLSAIYVHINSEELTRQSCEKSQVLTL